MSAPVDPVAAALAEAVSEIKALRAESRHVMRAVSSLTAVVAQLMATLEVEGPAVVAGPAVGDGGGAGVPPLEAQLEGSRQRVRERIRGRD